MKILDWHPDLAKRPEVPSAGCGALASIQQEDLGQAQQEEHGTQHHHALFELHVHTDRPRPPPHPSLCVSPAAIAPHPWRMAPAAPRHLPPCLTCQPNSSEGRALRCLPPGTITCANGLSPGGREREIREGWRGRWERTWNSKRERNRWKIYCQ